MLEEPPKRSECVYSYSHPGGLQGFRQVEPIDALVEIEHDHAQVDQRCVRWNGEQSGQKKRWRVLSDEERASAWT